MRKAYEMNIKMFSKFSVNISLDLVLFQIYFSFYKLILVGLEKYIK